MPGGPLIVLVGLDGGFERAEAGGDVLVRASDDPGAQQVRERGRELGGPVDGKFMHAGDLVLNSLRIGAGAQGNREADLVDRAFVAQASDRQESGDQLLAALSACQ